TRPRLPLHVLAVGQLRANHDRAPGAKDGELHLDACAGVTDHAAKRLTTGNNVTVEAGDEIVWLEPRRRGRTVVIDQQHFNTALVSQVQRSCLLVCQVVELNAKIAGRPLRPGGRSSIRAAYGSGEENKQDQRRACKAESARPMA